MAEREELRMKKEQKEEWKLLRQQKVEEKQADRETAKRSIAPGKFARFHAEFLGVGEKYIS